MSQGWAVLDHQHTLALEERIDLAEIVAAGHDPRRAFGQLLQILAGELEPDSGSVRWGVTITPSYFPKENSSYFTKDLNLIEWLCQFPPHEGESFARGFLGRMLFSGDEINNFPSPRIILPY